jgi:ankyrin repeat protein
MKNNLNETNEQNWLASDVKVVKTERFANEKKVYIEKYPLHYASSEGDLEKVKEFLKKEAVEINEKDHNSFTPLHIAAGQNHWDIVIELLQHGADPNAQDDEGNTPMHLAAEGNDLKILKCLVKNKYGSKGNLKLVNDYD